MFPLNLLSHRESARKMLTVAISCHRDSPSPHRIPTPLRQNDETFKTQSRFTLHPRTPFRTFSALKPGSDCDQRPVLQAHRRTTVLECKYEPPDAYHRPDESQNCKSQGRLQQFAVGHLAAVRRRRQRRHSFVSYGCSQKRSIPREPATAPLVGGCVLRAPFASAVASLCGECLRHKSVGPPSFGRL